SSDSENTPSDASALPSSAAWQFYNDTLGAPRFILAPMVDQSELAWRLLARRHGAQLCYTPMFHASVFVRDKNYRQLSLQTCPEDRPLIVQFCANDADTLCQAAKLAQHACDAIDLNLGCPQSIARRGHYGAFLQDEWDLICGMISKCAAELSVPITTKIRVFESVEKSVNYAQRLVAAGASILTVHGRTREQKGCQTGLASWSHIQAIRQAVNVPVVANGNIEYLADALACLANTGCCGVMSAEGHLHNPGLFESAEHQPAWVIGREYLQLARDYPCPLSYARGHVFKLLHHLCTIFPKIRDEVAAASSLDDLQAAMDLAESLCEPHLANAKAAAEAMEPDVRAYIDRLPLRFWLCQPYRRHISPMAVAAASASVQGDVAPDAAAAAVIASSAEAAEAREQRDRRKARSLAESGKLAEQRRQRRLAKEQRKQRARELRKLANGGCGPNLPAPECSECRNPSSLKCSFALCKRCCRNKTAAEILDCVGHEFMRRTQKCRKQLAQEKKLQQQQQQVELEAAPGASQQTENLSST
ncbi:hypothetical protein BOX15_Mlig011803g1, partial [Macrostomum lignano]